MKKTNIISLVVASLFSLATYQLANATNSTKKIDDGKHKGINFISNNDQWPISVLYKTELYGNHLFVENNKLSYVILDNSDINTWHHCKHENDCSGLEGIDAHAFSVNFKKSNSNTTSKGFCPSKVYTNHLKGSNPHKWGEGSNHYKEVEIQELYDGIDLRLYSQEKNLKYDLIVHPGHDPREISMEYEGLDGINLHEGCLQLHTSIETITEKAPYAYQYINKIELQVPCNFVLEGNLVRFEFPSGYDNSRPLIIDPAVVFSSYTGSAAQNWAYASAYDNTGAFYSAGAVFDVGYPTTLGAYQLNFAEGLVDIAISKFSADGSNLEYSTYLGGSGADIPISLIVDGAKNLYLMGITGSSDFPMAGSPVDNSFNGGNSIEVTGIDFTNGSDIILAKLSPDGDQLLASTYFGGSENDGFNTSEDLQYYFSQEVKGEIYLSNNGTVAIASTTNSADFPATPGSFQSTFGGGTQDAFVAQFNSDFSSLGWATFIGGSEDDAAYAIRYDDDRNLYIGGGTASSDFPTSPSALNPNYLGGVADGFCLSFSPIGGLLNSTFIGTSEYDQVSLLDVDENNVVYLTGNTTGAYPISTGLYNNPNSGQFLQELDNNLEISERSTVFGSENGFPNLAITTFGKDACNRTFIAGWGGLVGNVQDGFNTLQLPITPDAFQSETSGSNFYLAVLSNNWEQLDYASYLGNSNDGVEHTDGGHGRISSDGRLYQAVCGSCSGSGPFPTTPGVWSTESGSSDCNLVALLVDFNDLESRIDANPYSVGIAPLQIQFSANPQPINADYFWDFDNATFSTESDPLYTYTDPGLYEVSLVIDDLSACADPDTSFLTIEVYGPEETLVWPGDTDMDGIADVSDLLPIGLGFGSTGPTRPTGNTNWSPQYCMDWANEFPDTIYTDVNYKHGDCNSDGIIDEFDSEVIALNYGLMHSKTEDITGGGAPLTWELEDTIIAGYEYLFSINLGSAAEPVENGYGIAFQANIGVAAGAPDTLNLQDPMLMFGSTWLGNPATNLISLDTLFDGASTNQWDIALSRNDQLPQNGFGELCRIGCIMVIGSLNPDGKTEEDYFVPIELSFSNIRLINHNGREIPVSPFSSTAVVKVTTTGSPDLPNQDLESWVLYPNPANKVIFINPIKNQQTNTKVQLFDLAGHLVHQQELEPQDYSQPIDLSNLARGCYLVQLKNKEEQQVHKLILAY